MSSRTRRYYSAHVRKRKRAARAILILASVVIFVPLAIALAFGGGASPPKPPPPPPLVSVVGDGVSFQTRLDQVQQPPALAAWLAQIPNQHTVHRGPATLTYQTDRAQLEQATGQAIRTGGGNVALPEHVTSSSISLPEIQQAYRNNCETAALSMLLAGASVNVSQLDLLKDLPKASPIDQQTSPSGGITWGDPDLGFVGHPDAGSKGAGYGVYQGPIKAVAQKHGVALTDLTGSAPDKIYQTLLSGRPVMIWVGLTDGPYQTWTTPQGKQVVGNFGEHTVVLTGENGSSVTVNDPLSGQVLNWGNPYFEQLWQRLGRRALSL